MVVDGEGRRRVFGRQRRANSDAPRSKKYEVKVTPEEDVQLRARAAVRQVTVPRLLFEAAMSGELVTSTDRKEIVAEIFAIRFLLGNISNNMNQLARFANTEGQFPADAEAAAQLHLEAGRRLNDLLDWADRT